ncbi:MAG TPA: hypothetical protein VH877_03945 [Polyangia bacterium]|jgi:hypothetical protein|nr:hypothetical protein [Polyangia bacterium]
MDPHVGPVTVKISGTSALLLTKLAEALGTDDGGAVLMRALGLLDLALRAKREGKRLAFIDPATGQSSEVAF